MDRMKLVMVAAAVDELRAFRDRARWLMSIAERCVPSECVRAAEVLAGCESKLRMAERLVRAIRRAEWVRWREAKRRGCVYDPRERFVYH